MSIRLTLAAERGLIADAPVAVFRADRTSELAALPAPLTVVTGFAPDADALSGAGYRVVTAPDGRFASCIVCLPRAKALQKALVAEALDCCDGTVWIDGPKDRGVDSLLKELRGRGTVGEVMAKAHGKLFAFEGAPEALADWRLAPQTIEGGFTTWPGVFSADGIDRGSAELAAALPPLKGAVADLGAGWGFLARAMLASDTVTACHLVEAEHLAVEAARANVTDPRAQFHWADATTIDLPPLDAIVTNPPFHTGRTADPGLGRAFLTAAHRLLKPSGQLWLVANRHLPYEAHLDALFGEVKALPSSPSYKLYRASRPRRRA